MQSNLKNILGAFVFVTPAEPCFAGSASLLVSDEVSGNNATGRNLSDALDDNWSSSFPSGTFRPDLFSTGAGLSGSKSFTDPSSNPYQVDWQFGYIDDVGPGLPGSTNFINVTSGNVIYGASNSIQSGAPNPYSGETRVSTGFSGSGLNGVRFDFGSSSTDILEFGIYVGDLETRANNGTSGRVIVFDKSGGLIDDLPINNTGTVLSSTGTITYSAIEPNGSPSGPNNNNLNQWGNRTAVFLSISASEAIGSLIIHVGDDDHTSNHTGTQEQLGLAGFSLPSESILPPTPGLTLTKMADDNTDRKPGETVTYTYTVSNTGNVIINNVSVSDVHNGTGSLSPIGGDAIVTDGGASGDSSDATPDNGEWSVLGPGDSVSFTSTYIVTGADVISGGDITNIATVTGSPIAGALPTDPITANESVSVTRLEVDLSITKTNTSGVNGEVDQPADTLISGDNTTYTLVVANNGPDSITGAVVKDIVGAGLSCTSTDVVSLSGDGVPSGSFTIADLTGSGITLGSLDDGDAATLTYACLVN